MSKSLILFRHAHAEWQAENRNDHDRVLSSRGEEEAKKVGLLLKQQHALPQLILCSSAIRAESTANIANDSGGWACPVQLDDTLYNTHTSYVFNYIHKLKDDKDRIMLVGHEPTWSDVSNQLLSDLSRRLSFSTAMMVEINFDTPTWSSIQPASGTLNWILGPNDE